MLPIIDTHIHIAARERADCRVSDKMRHMMAFDYMVLFDGINVDQLNRHFDETIRTHILKTLEDANSIDYGVLFAMDWVYNEKGDPVEKDSHFVVSNKYVQQLAAKNKKVLFATSVNPNRGENAGTKELEKCFDGGPEPVLLKWVPNSQQINPAPRDDPGRHDWFYRLLARLKLPLLCHTGPEYAIPVREGDQKLGDPRPLRQALDLGVTVIAAHCASHFYPLDGYDYVKELAKMMSQAKANGWSLYADVSAMCVACRAVETIKRIRETIRPERMILGSDYPIPVNDMPWTLMKNISFEKYLRILAIPNPIEKNYQQLLGMGFPPSIGSAAARILRLPKSK